MSNRRKSEGRHGLVHYIGGRQAHTVDRDADDELLVVDFLSKTPDGVTARELLEGLGIGERRVERALHRLAQRGVVG